MYGTLDENFKYWWSRGKYIKHEIPARTLYADQEVVERIPSFRGKDWPGEETDVHYFVRLENGVFVGFREPRTDKGRRRKYCDFPVYEVE